MNRYISVLAVFGIIFATAARAANESDRSEAPPNIVFILADDLGIECLSSYGGQSHRTPHIDNLAKQGMRFTHCFSNPYCSPSRASLLTGRYPFKNGLTEVLWNRERHAQKYLRTDQPSFARQLKSAGYATAIAGKWQLSFLHQRNTVNDFGFDQYQCWQIFDENSAKTTRFRNPYFNKNGVVLAKPIKDQYGPEVNIEFLVDFIQSSDKEDKPFLAYYTCLLPHFPWVPTPDSEDQDYVLPNNAHKGDPKYFPDMVRYLDKTVGRLMQAIDDAGVADNTVLIFLADNGTDRDLMNTWVDGKTVEGGKGTMTDRGTHVPLIVRWPGRVKPGAVCMDLIDFSDFLPTLCQIAEAPLPAEAIHGRSFMPQLLGEQGSPRSWVHIQDKRQRHLRNRDYILPLNGPLRPVVELWHAPAKPYTTELSPEAKEAETALKKVFKQLGN
ncbi:MAG: sulfatase-like hydrolase/transferase [Phycisphaeraceae bacterium]